MASADLGSVRHTYMEPDDKVGLWDFHTAMAGKRNSMTVVEFMEKWTGGALDTPSPFEQVMCCSSFNRGS